MAGLILDIAVPPLVALLAMVVAMRPKGRFCEKHGYAECERNHKE